MTNVSLDQLSFAAFAELLHSQFRVHAAPATVVELELVEASSRPAKAAINPALESFSLIFCGPADRPLAQQMYLFEHPKIGGFELFIVPIGHDQVGFRYEAIFNRSLPCPSQ